MSLHAAMSLIADGRPVVYSADESCSLLTTHLLCLVSSKSHACHVSCYVELDVTLHHRPTVCPLPTFQSAVLVA
jgi:hypothetical protein